MKKTLRDIGERKFLSIIEHLVDQSLLNFNDDSSAIKLPSGEILVINVDMLVNKTDVLPTMNPDQIGGKAVTMAVSDVIVKGAEPIGCLTSVGFSNNMIIEKAQQVIRGIKNRCIKYNISFLGGDLNESTDMVVDTVAFGLCEEKNLIPRKGASDGDLIYSTGLFGLTSIGFKILLENLSVKRELRNKALSAVCEPQAKIKYIEFLKKSPIIISMDSSDGLSATLQDLSKINNLGITIGCVPIDPLVYRFSLAHSLNPLDLVFNGGEEFEIIFGISTEKRIEVEKRAQELGLQIYPIGFFTKDHSKIKITDSEYKDIEFVFKGYNHFR